MAPIALGLLYSKISDYMPSRQTLTSVANEAVQFGVEAARQLAPYVPTLRVASATLSTIGIAASLYKIGPGRISRFVFRQEGQDRLSPNEVASLKSIGAMVFVWGALYATEEYMRRNWNPERREFTEQDYVDEARRNLDRWVKPKMTLSDPLAPLRGDSFVDKCVTNLTYGNGNAYGKPHVVADIKWDPACWNNYKALNIEYSTYKAATEGSLSWKDVPVEPYFRDIDQANSFVLVRFLNPSSEAIPAGQDNEIMLYLRKPEACSMALSWEKSCNSYSRYRDVINKFGGRYDFCDQMDTSKWPDTTQRVKDFYTKETCKFLALDYPGHPPQHPPECVQ